MIRRLALVSIVALALTSQPHAQQSGPGTPAFEAETLMHFQALLQRDTSSPPGNEIRAVEYLRQVLDAEGIPYQVFAKDPQRPNLVVRIKGNGKKKPVLVMGHTDVVTVDPKKWTFPPFAGTVDGGYVYGRGTVDDKDNLVAGLMLVLQLARSKTPLDRDVILLAESGEEGAPDVGAQFMADQHFDAIDAEFCLAEGGGVVRTGGRVRRANVGTTEKEPRFVELVVTGPAGHGSVPNQNSAVLGVAAAIGRIGAWTPPLRLNETTASVLQEALDDCRARRGAEVPRPAESRPEGAQAGRGLDARQRAGALVDDAHVARPDHPQLRVPLQRDSV